MVTNSKICPFSFTTGITEQVVDEQGNIIDHKVTLFPCYGDGCAVFDNARKACGLQAK